MKSWPNALGLSLVEFQVSTVSVAGHRCCSKKSSLNALGLPTVEFPRVKRSVLQVLR